MFFYLIYMIFLFLFSLSNIMFSLIFSNYEYSIFMDYMIFSLNSCVVVYTILLDWMSLLFMGSVSMISSMVLFYSYVYMNHYVYSLRFLYLVFLFVVSMFLMIISPNLISILLGWDGLGLVSYALVIFFQNNSSYSAGMLTILMNRMGDVALLISIGWCFSNGLWDLFSMYFNEGIYMNYVFILLVICAFTKSAQIPFSSWLPAAMAAPTPVSALVHSSTLVTAGVYLLIRFNLIYYFFNTMFFFYLSLMTMFMAGLVAVFEYDLKKIIALSTLSQLGLMMSIIFVGFPLLSFMHLLTHAFFKALLFLCAGLMIHVMGDTQDIRYMGGMGRVLPFTTSMFMVSNISLFGFPFLSGFFSKDLILESVYISDMNFMVYFVFFISVGLTAAYTFRLFYYVVFSHSCWSSAINYEESFLMNFSMMILLFMSVFMGKMLTYYMFSYTNLILMPFFQKMMPLFIILVSSWLVLELYFAKSFVLLLTNSFIYNFMGSMWFLNKLSTLLFYSNSSNLFKGYSICLDFSWGEYFFSKSLFYSSLLLSKIMIMFHENNLKVIMIAYFFIMMLLFY
uniref:NADH-ubiquinone oxidoreductase chain 5 n=1 Tax=Onymocoris hackeri TaxID=2813039 RepID=A0A8T9ZY32_9HEMI|nr:NADH dehydrogenase subunit 5 [Onymocoris hackeri]